MRVLVLIMFVALVYGQDADESLAAFKKLQTEYSQARDEFYKPYREAKDKSAVKLDYSKFPDNTFAPRFEKLARAHAGTPGARKALVLLLRIGRSTETKQWALDTLLADHVESEDLKSAVFQIRYHPGGESALKTLVEKSPHDSVKGPALLALGQIEKNRDLKKALAIFEQVKEQYETQRAQAEAEIFEIENLSVGKPAPDIEGEDIDGVAFKLSDYKGKVILLDFWGDW